MGEDRGEKQLWLSGFEVPFEMQLDPGNRWVRLAQIVPWAEFGAAYEESLKSGKSGGRPPKSSRLIIGAVIIKHKLCLSDEETVSQIQENPYLQFFCGLPAFSVQQPFAPSLFVEIRKRMGATVFDRFQDAIIGQVPEGDGDSGPKPEGTGAGVEAGVGPDPDVPDEPDRPAEPDGSAESSPETPPETPPENRGKLVIDATACDQMIRFPTDISLLNEAREISERLVDGLYKAVSLPKKPRTYRQKARKDFLGFVKQRRPRKNVRRTAIRKQLQYLRRNLSHISTLCDALSPETACPPHLSPAAPALDHPSPLRPAKTDVR